MRPGREKLILELGSCHLEKAEAALAHCVALASHGRAVTLFFSGPAVLFLTKEGLQRAARSSGEAFSTVTERQALLGLGDIGVHFDAAKALDVTFIADRDDSRYLGLDAADFTNGPAVIVKSRGEILRDTDKHTWMVF